MAEKTNREEATVVQPIIVDLGKQKKKRIKDLKRGEGKLMDEVMEVVAQVEDKIDADGKVIVPVVVIYRKKDNNRIGLLGL
jgi:hypothetical protein